MNRRQEINKILHTHLDVNKHDDYTNYKALITAIENWHESEIKKLNLHVVNGCAFAVDDKVKKGNKLGVVTRISDKAVHVQYSNGLFEKFHFNPRHHMQTHINLLEHYR